MQQVSGTEIEKIVRQAECLTCQEDISFFLNVERFVCLESCLKKCRKLNPHGDATSEIQTE